MNYTLVNRVLLHLSKKCNLSCKHCYATSYDGVDSFSYDFSQLQRTLLSFNKPVDITGGEPFLFSNLKKFIETCTMQGIRISSIFTNGTLIEKNLDIVDYLKENNPNMQFYVSLDGFHESHDRFRGNGSFELALNGATILKSRGFKVFINSILHKNIHFSDLENLYNEIQVRSFDRWRIDTPFNSGNWKKNRHNDNLSLIKTFEYFNYVLNIWLDDNKRFELEIDHVLKYINGQFYFIDRYSENNPICPCKLLVIWPNGNITWCQDLYSTNCVIANIYSDSPEQIYSAYLPYKQKTIFEMKKYLNDCGTCGFIHFCGTGCRANAILEENGYFGKDEEICSLYTSGLYKKIASTLISNKDNIL